MTTYHFDCIGCGNELYVRDVNSFTDGETESCSECGMLHMISADVDDAAVTTSEHYEDIGQPRCDNSCDRIYTGSPALVAEYMGTPCAWTCEKAKSWTKEQR